MLARPLLRQTTKNGVETRSIHSFTNSISPSNSSLLVSESRYSWTKALPFTCCQSSPKTHLYKNGEKGMFRLHFVGSSLLLEGYALSGERRGGMSKGQMTTSASTSCATLSWPQSEDTCPCDRPCSSSLPCRGLSAFWTGLCASGLSPAGWLFCPTLLVAMLLPVNQAWSQRKLNSATASETNLLCRYRSCDQSLMKKMWQQFWKRYLHIKLMAPLALERFACSISQ